VCVRVCVLREGVCCVRVCGCVLCEGVCAV
jgi:hypothetical protein